MKTIYSCARETGLLETWTAAVDVLGMTEVLTADDYLTVFAPSDEAFRSMPRERVEEMLESKESFLATIANHLVPGKIMTSEMDHLSSVRSLMKNELLIESGPERFVSEARISRPNLECRNGVIHIVDRVLIIRKHRKATLGAVAQTVSILG
jgi:uncharacterized surface protein with fasciclin (FAS1) repeats